MKTHSSISIILGHKNLGEMDKSIFLYNEELGKIKVIAKGSRKLTSKFTGHLETLNFCETSLYFGPRNIILTEIETLANFKETRQNLHKLNCALQVAEITNRLLYENQKVDNLMTLLKETLTHINSSSKPQLAAIYYIIKFLDKLGFIPDFKEINSSIANKYRKFLHFTQNQPLSQVQKIALQKDEEREIKELITRVIQYHTQITPQSLSRQLE